MLVPNITFNESNTGVSPIRPGVRNRVGIVGEFSRGPVNTFNYVNGYSEFATKYGSDLAKGSLGFQAAWDQGARDFGIVRVLGHATPAYGQALFSGISTKANYLNMDISYVGPTFAKFGVLETVRITTLNSYYTDSEAGRYFFKATSVAGNVVTVKYKFLNLSQVTNVNEVNIDWSTVTDSISVNKATDSGVSKTAANLKGVALKFTQLTGQTAIELNVGYEFSVKVVKFAYTAEVTEGATYHEVIDSLISTISGADPFGTVVATPNYDGVIFYLDETNSSILGEELGSHFSYTFTLDSPDAVVKSSVTSGTGSSITTLTLNKSLGQYITVGDDVYHVTSGVSVVANNTKVASVSTVGNTTTVTLDTALTNAALATTNYTFKFVKQEGLSIEPYTNLDVQTMSGGIDGPRNAVLDFYPSVGTIPILRIISASAGRWGNNIKVKLKSLGVGKYSISVKDYDSSSYNPSIADEFYNVDLLAEGAIAPDGQLNVLANSNLIKAYFLPATAGLTDQNYYKSLTPQRLSPANNSITDTTDPRNPSNYGPIYLAGVDKEGFSLEGGYDGPQITEDDYIKALNLLKDSPVHIILTPGIWASSKVRSHLISVAEAGTELEGLKIAVLNAPPSLNPSQAKQVSKGLDSRRAVMVAGWSTYAGQPNSPRFGVSPDAFYAGKLASLPFQVSPNARTSAGSLLGVTEVDIQKYNSMYSLQQYTDAKLEILTLDPQVEAFFFVNGRTLSSSSAWDKVIIRRTYDVIRADIYNNMLQYRSEPHTKLLRKQIATSINAYMAGLARNGKIANFGGCICDDSNNPPNSYLTGELNVYISFLPLYAADYINISISRNSAGGLQTGE